MDIMGEVSEIYRIHETYDAKKILQYMHVPILYADLGDVTLGYTLYKRRMFTITVSNQLSEPEIDYVLGHELKHVLERDTSTPYMRRIHSNTPILKKERIANDFSLALISNKCGLIGFGKQKQIQLLGLEEIIY